MASQAPLASSVNGPDVRVANKEDAATVGADLWIDQAIARDPRHLAVGPSKEFAAQGQQHHVGLLRPDVLGNPGLAKAKALAAQRLLG